MDVNRKKIIVKEILYWKDSRLLPERYCDYLLALYTEGNQPINDQVGSKQNKKQNSKSFLFLLLIPIAVFLIYFTELSFILQMGLITILIFCGLAAAFYFSKKGILYQVPIIVSALILLLFSVEMAAKIFPKSQEMLYIILFLNCGLWLFTGWKLNLIYFKISALLGIVLILISIFI